MVFFSSRKKLATSSTFQRRSYPQSAEKWELDAGFFAALSQWTLDHPDSTLDRVLQRANKAVDNGKDYIDMIPDTPFPARGLVKSVAQLVRLSAKISRAQKEVRDFALKIIHWVNRVKESFAKAGNGRFTKRTWDNLASMRELIHEICGWASERLNDHRWNISNAKIEDEIHDFQARLDEAEKLFNFRLLIAISAGLDAILQFLSATQEEHFKRILMEQERQRFLDEVLRPYTIQDSTYTAQKKQPCDPDTCMDILGHIQAWIYDHSDVSSKNFLWLVGLPGCGKSAITASIARECKSRKILGAQFFINRNNHNTTNPTSYFPTVARALAKRSDLVEWHLYNALKGPIYSVDTPQEAAKLFVDIVGKAASSDPNTPVVIVFDGLDETSRDSLEDTATIFSQLFTSLRNYPNAKILISSRPEDQILKSFKHTPDKEYIIELLINTDDPTCRRDVKTFLNRRLTEIAARHGLSSVGWPGNDDVEKMADRASGLFIWAVTASNYINTRLRRQGKEILKTVLHQFNNNAMKEINTLYYTILNSVYSENNDPPWIFETFRRLIGAVMVLWEPVNIRDLDALLDLREIPDSDRVDVRNFVENLRTLLVADLDDFTDDTVPRAHKSFYDFITSTGDHIPDHFHVDVDESNAEMAFLCLYHLTNAYSDIYNTHYASKESDLKVISTAARYSLRFALPHMPEWHGTTFGVLSDHPGITKSSQLDVLLRHSSHSNHAGPLSFSVPSNHAVVKTSFEKHSLIWNTEDGSATKAISIDPQFSLRISPGGTRIFSWYPQEVRWGPEHSYDLTMSSSVATAPLQDYELLEFSFNGTKFVHVTGHKTTFLYSASPDSVAAEIPNRHHTKIRSLCLSQNCSYIASSPEKRSIIDIWDISSVRYINQPDSMRYEYPVECMSFSPDTTMLISCDKQCAHIWEIPTCTRRRHTFTLHPGGPYSVAFSLDSRTVLAGSKEGIVFLWNPHTGNQIGEPWKVPAKGDNNAVYKVAFRSCGNIALAFCGDSVYVWNVHQATLLTVIPNTYLQAVFTPDGSHLLYVQYKAGLGICNLAPLLLNSKDTFKPKWTALSPGGSLVISVATDELLCWRLDAVNAIGNPLKGNVTSVTAIAFSLDESHIAGAAEDGTMYLWDSTTCEVLSSLPACVFGVSSLSFSPEGDALVARLKDNQSVVLAVADHELRLLVLNEYERTCALEKITTVPKLTFFDLDKSPITFGTAPAAPNRRLEDVRWYPSRSDSVAWAYVNNHIVRAGKDGSFVVVPVGNPSSD